MTSEFLIKNGQLFIDGKIEPGDFAVVNGRIASTASNDATVIDCAGALVLPSFADVHVHFREPGFTHKETIATGSRAAAAGGYTDVWTMPNLNPVPDSVPHIKEQLDAIAASSVIHTHPLASITIGEKGEELTDIEALAPFAAAFSDDGKGVQDRAFIKEAMLRAKAVGKTIVAHCEDNSLLTPGGCVHEGDWSRSRGLIGISSESEWKMVERDIALVRETGAPYHVCHVSTKETVALVREAKREGLPVTCETAPHYLVMCDEELDGALAPDGGRFKMNPPIRSKEDRQALIEGLLDGTVDCIATDHAPHSAEEKAQGVSKSPFGIVGLETAFPILYTYLVETQIVPLSTIIRALAYRPREIFGGTACRFAVGDEASFTVVATDKESTVDVEKFLSMGRATPFAGWKVSAEINMTFCDGKLVWKRP